MLKKSEATLILILILALLMGVTVAADDVPFPGPPHEFYGTVKDTNGNSMPDGTEVKALVDNETYTTAVKNGEYGFNKPYYPPLESDPSPFYVEDPGFDNEGKTIYFYVNNINTSQTAIFTNGVITRLDLVVNLNSGGVDSGENGGAGGPLSDEALPSTPFPPVADAKGPYRGRVNQTIIFYGLDSYDPDGVIVNYTWDFGDGNTSYEINPSHAYTTQGVFKVTLTVADNDNLTNTTSTTVTIIVDSDGDGWSDEEEEQYGTNETDPYDFPTDNDGDYIPDEYDIDDDNDRLTDEEEINLGSNPKNSSDVTEISNDFGVFFFVDTDEDGLPDTYYNKTNGINTTLKPLNNTSYLVDIDGDGNWDYIYSHAENNIALYTEGRKTGSNWVYSPITLLLTIIVILVVLLFIYRKKFRGGKK